MATSARLFHNSSEYQSGSSASGRLIASETLATTLPDSWSLQSHAHHLGHFKVGALGDPCGNAGSARLRHHCRLQNCPFRKRMGHIGIDQTSMTEISGFELSRNQIGFIERGIGQIGK